MDLFYLDTETNSIIMTDSCSKISGFCLLAISVMLVIVSGVGYLNSHSFEEGNCLITNVTYPQSITDSANLISCDCGRRCTSDTGTCIRISGYLLESPQIRNRYFVSSVDVKYPTKDCTFAETKCIKGEKVADRMVSIERAKKKAMEYIVYQNNEKVIPCFYQKGNNYLYLENDDVSLFFFISCGCLLLSIFCLCCCFCRSQNTTEKSAFV